METERTPVQVGIDLRPVPLTMSDGTVWHLEADPDKSFFAKTQRLAKKMQAEDVADEDDLWDVVDEMRETLASQIPDETERKAFIERGYGIAVLGAISAAYAESVVALPTESSSPSGRGPKGTGGNRSRGGR